MTRFVLLAGLSLALAACSATDPQTTTDAAAGLAADSTAVPVASVYTCPMHPKVVSSQPGQCPECGMGLVVKK